MEIIPIFGSTSGIGANSYGIIAEFEVPSGKVAELFSVGVIPDYDPTTGASNLDYVYIAHSHTKGELGSAFPHSRFSATWGKNSLPFGTGADKTPRYQFDVPGMPENLTYKFLSGDVIQIVGKARPVGATGTVKACMFVALLDKAEAEAIYGVPADEFVNLPGGYASKHLKLLFAEIVDFTTTGSASFEPVYTNGLQSFEALRIAEIGVSADDNADLIRFYDESLNKYFPYLDDAKWTINPKNNMLPFGDPVNDYQPRANAPTDLASHEFTNTNFKILVKDNGSASSGRIQLIGVYERR